MARINIEKASLEELEQECMNVVGTPFGHNMIGIICNVVERRFNEDEAKQLFNKYQKGIGEEGWNGEL